MLLVQFILFSISLVYLLSNIFFFLGKTPLHIAVMQSNALLVRLLLTYKASLSQKDNDGHTAAYYSVSQEISEELSDPVVAPLLGCIRSGKLTEEVERILRYSCDMPGCLTARDLLDVDCGGLFSFLFFFFYLFEFFSFLLFLFISFVCITNLFPSRWPNSTP